MTWWSDFRRRLAFHQNSRSPGLLENPRIVGLMIVRRRRVGNQHGGQSVMAQLRERGCTRAADDHVGKTVKLFHLGRERLHDGGEPLTAIIDLCDIGISLSREVDELYLFAVLVPQGQRLEDEFVDPVRPLAPARSDKG